MAGEGPIIFIQKIGRRGGLIAMAGRWGGSGPGRIRQRRMDREWLRAHSLNVSRAHSPPSQQGLGGWGFLGGVERFFFMFCRFFL